MHGILSQAVPGTHGATGLFWSAPMPSDSDFTAEDPLAFDYLGQQIGLWLFPGFTTRTSRAQYYAVVLYGLHLAQRAIETYGLPADDDTRTRLFERWERFWALATLESRAGVIERGDVDSMRGIRGARRAWQRGNGPLPLDFELISRQSELGGLGAYLSSLRHHQLVGPGSLRVTPLAGDIVDAFWSEKGARDMARTYEGHVLTAMNPKATTWKRVGKSGLLTLAGLGIRSRLSSIHAPERAAQRERLWNVLFKHAKDAGTPQLASSLIKASARGIREPEPLLAGMAEGHWGLHAADLRQRAELGLAFGRLARWLLDAFNRAYRHVDEHGWNCVTASASSVAFPREQDDRLRTLSAALTGCALAPRLDDLAFHGQGFMALVRSLDQGGATDRLRRLLHYHGQVQKTRRGAAPWLQEDGGRLVMKLPGYTGHRAPADFPPLKLHTVRQLLFDLDRLR